MNLKCRYDIVGFSKDLGLSLKEVSVLYDELIKEFNLGLSELEVLMNKKDLDSIKKIIHNIKGVSGNYRITDIYTETSRLNDYFRNNPCENVEFELNNLFKITNRAKKEIESFFR